MMKRDDPGILSVIERNDPVCHGLIMNAMEHSNQLAIGVVGSMMEHGDHWSMATT